MGRLGVLGIVGKRQMKPSEISSTTLVEIAEPIGELPNVPYITDFPGALLFRWIGHALDPIGKSPFPLFLVELASISEQKILIY